jgi:hypothetical protein
MRLLVLGLRRSIPGGGLRVRLLRRAYWRTASWRVQSRKTVVHQRYVNDRTAVARFCGFRLRGISHPQAINSVYRHFVVDYQVAYDRICHGLRSLYSCLATRVRVALHFNDVALLTFQLRRNLIKSFLGFLIQCGLSRAEVKFCIGDLLVLVEIADRRIQLIRLRAGLCGQLLGLTSLGRSLQSLLICLVCRSLRLVDTSLRAGIDILDIIRVLGGELIQLIQPVFNRRNLTIDPLLPRQRIHLAPEAFVRLGRQRLTGSVSGRIAGATRSTRGSRCRGGGAGLRSAARRRGSLRHHRRAQTGGQQDCCDRSRGCCPFIHACPFFGPKTLEEDDTPLASSLDSHYCNWLAKRWPFVDNNCI